MRTGMSWPFSVCATSSGYCGASQDITAALFRCRLRHMNTKRNGSLLAERANLLPDGESSGRMEGRRHHSAGPGGGRTIAAAVLTAGSRIEFGLLFLSLVVLSACDRGWTYRVPQGTLLAEHRYALTGPEGTRLHVDATVFTIRLHVEIEVWNAAEDPLDIEPSSLSVLRGGKALSGLLRVDRCEGFPEGRVTLATGASCRMRATFYAPQTAKELEQLTLVRSGVRRQGNPVSINVLLTVR